MSGMFQLLDGETAVLYQSGVYKEVAVAMRYNGELYAKARGGFVRLYADGSTSLGSKCRLDALTIDLVLYKDRLGKLCIYPATGRTRLGDTPGYITHER